MASSRRIEKINILMREVTAELLSKHLQFSEEVLVTVTRVEASEDLHYATIFVSVLAKNGDREKSVLRELSHSVGLIQQELNRKLRMRPVPRISFKLDQDEKRRERIEKLLSEDAPRG